MITIRRFDTENFFANPIRTTVSLLMTEDSEYQALSNIMSGTAQNQLDEMVQNCKHSDRLFGQCGSCDGIWRMSGLPSLRKPPFLSDRGIRIERREPASISVSPNNGPDYAIRTAGLTTAEFDCVGPVGDIKDWIDKFIEECSVSSSGIRNRRDAQIPAHHKPKPLPEGLKGWLELGKFLKANEATVRADGGYTVPAELSVTGRAQFVPYVWPEEENATAD